MVSREMTWGCYIEDDTETPELLFLQIGCKNLILLRPEAMVWLSRVSKNSCFNWTHVESNPSCLRGSCGCDLCAFLTISHYIQFPKNCCCRERMSPFAEGFSYFLVRDKKGERNWTSAGHINVEWKSLNKKGSNSTEEEHIKAIRHEREAFIWTILLEIGLSLQDIPGKMYAIITLFSGCDWRVS